MTTTISTTARGATGPVGTYDPSLATGEHEACGCEEGMRAAGSLTRRTFMAGVGATAAGVGLAASGVSTQVAFAETGYTGDTLVILSLRGGFDGLSAVIPVGDPGYHVARPHIGIPASQTLRITRLMGLHPAMRPMLPIWNAGHLAFVHAIGQVNPTRSHFQAMEAMEEAAPGSRTRTGWLERMIGLKSAGEFASLSIGSQVPIALRGTTHNVALGDVDQFKLAGSTDQADFALWKKAISAMYSDAPLAMKQSASNTMGAVATMNRLQKAGYRPLATYPSTPLGTALKNAARMIKGGVGVRAITIDAGHWDMHVNMGRSDHGWMHTQLGDLASCLAAFWKDLGSKQGSTTLVTMSEFGRRVHENASGGVDHGHGNVSMVMGGGVIGKKIYGRWPGLAPKYLDHGDLAATTDYRMMLAEMLEKRGKLGTSTVFPGLVRHRLHMFRQRY